MANCIYTLKGRIFGSVLELDNFLLNNKNSINNGKLSDIIFSRQHTQSEVITILDQKRQEAASIQEIKRVKALGGSVTFEDERLASPYIGANKLLTKFKAPNGRHFVNEFVEENLKNKLYADWESQGISEKHAKLIGETPGKKFTTPAQKENTWNKLNTAWKKLGEVGTASHRVMELLWDEQQLQQLQQQNPGLDLADQILQDNEVSGILTKEEIKSLITIQETIKYNIMSNPQFSNAKFYPEFPVTADTTYSENGEQKKLLGVIDLLVVDNNGKIHVFDYKFSNSEYSDWAKYKKIAYQYQLGAYKLALESYGLDTMAGKLGIIPLTFDDYEANGNFSKVLMELPGQIWEDYSTVLTPMNTIMHNLSQVIIDKSAPPPISNDFALKMSDWMHKAFPSYRFQQNLDQSIQDELLKELDYNDTTGKFKVRNPRGLKKTEFDSVEEYFDYLNQQNTNSFQYYKALIKRAMTEGDPTILSQEESKSYLSEEAESREWFQNQFEQFCTGNGEWEMIDIPEFEPLKTIVLYNAMGNYYKIFTIDNQNPQIKVKLKHGQSILGSFIDDISLEQSGIVPLTCDYGNINNIKVMLALNAYPDLIKPGATIEGIYPICPNRQLGHHAGAKQLTDNFRVLCQYANIENNFDKGKLIFQKPYMTAFQLIREYGVRQTHSGNLNKIWSKYETGALTLEENLAALIAVKNELENSYPDLKQMGKHGPKVDFNTPQGKAYGKIMQAISEIQNGYYTQSLRDGSKIQHLIDNPEIQEHNLRNYYKLITNCNEEYARMINSLAAEYREVQEKFWKKKGYSLARRNTLNDERILFEKMFEENQNKTGVFRFKDPWNSSSGLDDAEREFLKWILIKLAKLKNPSLTNAQIELIRTTKPEFFDVPLLRGKGSKNPFTSNGRKGVIQWFKKSMDYFKNFKSNLKSGIHDALTPKDAENAEKTAQAFEMFDMFERSDNQAKREEYLLETDLDILDHDVGNLFYTYAASKLRKQVLDKYRPMMQGQLVQLMMEAATNNINIDKNIDYILKYTTAKVFNASIVPKDYRILAKALEKTRTIATYLTLGFSPKSGLFQMIEGVWKNVSRAGFKPLGENQFGKEELMKAARWVLGDTPDHFKVVSMGELLNERYRINDMDINSYAKRLKEGQYPLTLAGKAMWMTSAPDYFNRMSIFIAQMIKDGCFDAYEKDGMRLKYNWKKDKRFNLFSQGESGKRQNLAEYNRQKALYHAMMAQFQKEGYQVPDQNGNMRDLQFDPTSDTFQDDLPEAYTNLDARNLKSFADQLYGYYNHEDQFLLKSMLLGAQFTQFRTYWSSLKNRWLLPGGIYSNGRWEQAKDKDGNLMFKKFNLDANGNLINVEIVPEDTGEPYMIWKGSYQEGILRTLGEGFRALFNPEDDRPLKERAISILHGEMGNKNEDVIKTRVTNLKLFAHDMAIWAIIGLLIGALLTKWLKEQEKADKNRKLGFGDMTLRHAESIFVSSLITSTQDLGAVKDLVSPLTDWTPPSFRIMQNIWEDGGKMITGDKSFTKFLVENVSVLRQTKNYWYKAEKAIEAS